MLTCFMCVKFELAAIVVDLTRDTQTLVLHEYTALTGEVVQKPTPSNLPPTEAEDPTKSSAKGKSPNLTGVLKSRLAKLLKVKDQQ